MSWENVLRKEILMLVFILLIPTFDSCQTDEVTVLISDSPASFLPYLHQVREGRCRFILTQNAEKVKNIMENMNMSFKILRESPGDDFLRAMDPHDLAYALLLASGLERVDASELPLLRDRARELEKEISQRRSDVSVVFFSSDGSDYAFLAAYAAVLKDAKLLDMDRGFDASLLRGSSTVIVVTRPLWANNSVRYERMMEHFTKIDEDPYLDVSFGILTGNSIETPFLMLMSDEILRRIPPARFVGISIIEDLPLAWKVERVASMMGLPTEVYHPDLSHSNMTEDAVSSILSSGRGIFYLSLHGNPSVMALRSDGYVLLGASTVRRLDIFGSMIITLSCSTLKFSEMESPNGSIAYAFLDSGALAYVGSTRVEFSVGSEFGTSYPDLLLSLLMNGTSLGEAVKIVNNLKIGDSGGRRDSASEVLLGDPTLRIGPGRLPFRVSGRGGRYIIEINGATPTLFLRVREEGVPSVTSGVPGLHVKWYGDEEGIFIYITTLSTSYAGYFESGDSVKVEMRKPIAEIGIIPYFLLMITVAISLIQLVRRR
ncbi:MAG: hypothetical protein BA066_00645 [Candidatus Korarchaeota archaeon NZ13-K]|nr:MAG: hypothetical protein BA066_00645 [Candidatus Korarchaeota archaeon NZ13-K]